MAEITLKGNKINTIGDIPPVGANLGDFNFKLTKTDLSDVGLDYFKGKRIVLNTFLSLDTEVCANSVRKFNEVAGSLENTVILCISKDLPYAHNRFCTTEGLENVVSLSEMRNSQFSESIGLKLTSGPLTGLIARSVIIVDEDLNVIHSQLVPEITDEPDYEKALDSIR